MTTEHEARRTLVKSPPELWAECSDAGSLARHLGEFGEIKITRLEPETTVAWEGEHASGTVQIEPSGWGTRVTLTAQTKAEYPEAEDKSAPSEKLRQAPVVEELNPAPIVPETHTDEEESDATATATLEESDPGPMADVGPARARWRRLTARMRGLFRAEPAAADSPNGDPAPVEAIAVPEPLKAEVPSGEPKLDAQAILTSALDSLGQAHHRPFSRA